jgi:hypothetical protein
VAGLLVLAMIVIAWAAPADRGHASARSGSPGGYWAIVGHPTFVRCAPLGFFSYGGLIAVQALWAGPWLTQVVGLSPAGAARGLFLINLTMLASFLTWGLALPRLMSMGWGPERLIALGWPVGAALMAAVLTLGQHAGAVWLAGWCVCTSVITLCQPAVAQAFPKAEAGRALAAFNLLVFLGIFACQWGVGLAIDALVSVGLQPAPSHRVAMALHLLGMVGAGLWYWAYPTWHTVRAAQARG